MTEPSNDHAFTRTELKGGTPEPTYAGALSFMRRKYTRDLTGVDVAVWGLPFDSAVTNRPGARFGPRGVREASVIMDNDPQYPFGFDIFEDLAVIDYGDCAFDAHRLWEVPDRMTSQASTVLDAGVHLFSIGGDHFVTYPMLKAHAARHGPLALVQFDAHQDTWDDDNERIDHGTMITRAVREGLIDIDHSIQIGIRTCAPETYGIEILHGLDVAVMRPAEIADRIRTRVGGRQAYFTFDIDCLDPAFAPGTGTPVSGGLTSAQALSVLRGLGPIDFIGGDVVEVAPLYDHANITSIAGSTVAMMYLGLLAEKKRL
ncbi:MAG: agmatinase [Pseudomonadota bacterium]